VHSGRNDLRGDIGKLERIFSRGKVDFTLFFD